MGGSVIAKMVGGEMTRYLVDYLNPKSSPSTLNDHNYTIMQPRIDHVSTTILQQENAPLVARKAEDSGLRAALIPLIA